MSWLEKLLNKKNLISTHKASIPEGIWTKCPSCDQVLYRIALAENLEVCPKCNHHMRMSARNRLESFLDKGEQTELGKQFLPQDLNFHKFENHESLHLCEANMAVFLQEDEGSYNIL